MTGLDDLTDLQLEVLWDAAVHYSQHQADGTVAQHLAAAMTIVNRERLHRTARRFHDLPADLVAIQPTTLVRCDRCAAQFEASEVAARLDCTATTTRGRCPSGDFDGVDLVDLSGFFDAAYPGWRGR